MRYFVILATLLPLPGWAQSLPDPVGPSDFTETEAEWVALGRLLFFDPILSGNENIACATCHHPAFGTSDGMSLSIGEGGIGLGPARKASANNAPLQRIPRNAPALWNLGARDFVTMFHDGRTEVDDSAPFGIRMPEGRALERPVPNALAAQNILPILSPDEMAGHAGENPVADAVAAGRIHGPGGAWDLVTAKVAAIPAYGQSFDWLLAGDAPHITDIGKALSSFIAFEFRATDSPFDRHLRGDPGALDAAQMRGMTLFYGEAGCSTCHSGPFQTDQSFHALGLPQLGPGKDETMQTYDDLGRALVTGEAEDRHRFRTPSLRNVTLTAPYGHNGAYASLRAILEHKRDPMGALTGYDRTQARLHGIETAREDFAVMADTDALIGLASSVELSPIPLGDAQIDDLIAFLGALTDEAAARGRLGIPDAVPSGLPLDPVVDPS